MAPAKVRGTVWDPECPSPTTVPNSPVLLTRFATALSPTSTPTPTPTPSPAASPIVYDKVKLNKDELENIFCAKKQKGSELVPFILNAFLFIYSVGPTNGTTAAPKQEETKEVSLLDMRRSNNLGMCIGHIGAPT